MKRPGLLSGAIVGAMLTAPVIAILYLADKIAGLPFVPYDVFAWVRDRLPGDVITESIDAMVEVITTLDLGRVDTTAKSIERMSGLGMVVVFGMIIAALLFLALNRLKRDDNRPYGLVAGLIAGIIMALISDAQNFTATASATVSVIWLVVVFVVWGDVVRRVYDRLSTLQPAAIPVEAETAETTASTTAEVAPKPTPVSTAPMGRREFLVQVGGATAVLTVVGAGVGWLLSEEEAETADSVTTAAIGDNPEATAEPTVRPPNWDATLDPAPGTRPEYTPLEDHYQIDIAPRPPSFDADDWRLAVTGLVAAPVSMSLDELRNNYEPYDEYITLSCISNPVAGSLISTTRWTGVPLHVLLDEWDLDPSATHLRIDGGDGFFEYVEIALARRDERVMLAYDWDGQPLKEKHGFPLRIYIPDRYGMKQPKWITSIEVVDEWDEGYWLRRGWSREALVQHTSVVDTIAEDATYEQDGQTYVPVGGIAYAGARGISKVEVQVDGGDWVEAELREPLSDLTWVVWRYDWPFVEGSHRFCVRCTDGRGDLQIEERGNREPDGVRGAQTGTHCKNENL